MKSVIKKTHPVTTPKASGLKEMSQLTSDKQQFLTYWPVFNYVSYNFTIQQKVLGTVRMVYDINISYKLSKSVLHAQILSQDSAGMWESLFDTLKHSDWLPSIFCICVWLLIVKHNYNSVAG